jgi:hypothetical protein
MTIQKRVVGFDHLKSAYIKRQDVRFQGYLKDIQKQEYLLFVNIIEIIFVY